jgi:hypothetical protein
MYKGYGANRKRKWKEVRFDVRIAGNSYTYKQRDGLIQ